MFNLLFLMLLKSIENVLLFRRMHNIHYLSDKMLLKKIEAFLVTRKVMTTHKSKKKKHKHIILNSIVTLKI